MNLPGDLSMCESMLGSGAKGMASYRCRNTEGHGVRMEALCASSSEKGLPR
jgi:hypothetical protein